MTAREGDAYPRHAMDDDELLGGRKRSRAPLIALAVLAPVFAAAVGGGWWVYQRSRRETERVLVEEVTGAAFGCVASVRGDAPELWGLERALEHMSRMERVTRDATNPATADERQRFARLAADAARGCEALGTLMMRAQRESGDLYFAVPASLAQPPDRDDPERWFRRVLPQSREDVVELTRQVRAMNDAINARRSEHELMPQLLPIEGRGATELARVVVLAPLPRELERPLTEVWPMPAGIVVVRRGSLARVPCDTRYLNPISCYSELLQTVAYDGTASEPLALERPATVTYWSSFAPTEDGSLYAVGIDNRNRGVVGRYAPGETRPTLRSIAAPVDAQTQITALTGGGVAVFPSDGSAWMSGAGIELVPAEETPPPLIVRESQRGAEHGITVGDRRLTIFGSEDFGWTSRNAPAEGQGEDILLRIVDAHRRVDSILQLRALADGRTVALLSRSPGGPDAIVVSPDFGRTWLSGGGLAGGQGSSPAAPSE